MDTSRSGSLWNHAFWLGGAQCGRLSTGDYIAVGAPDAGAIGARVGTVTVYRYNAGTWDTVAAIAGNASVNENFGMGVDISDNGQVLVVADNLAGNGNAGAIQAFCLEGNTWRSRGSRKMGDFNLEALGSSVSLSADGNIMVGGAVQSGTARGRTRVYTWNGNIWRLLPSINGQNDGDRSGRSSDVVVTRSGELRVAVGANFSNAGGPIQDKYVYLAPVPPFT